MYTECNIHKYCILTSCFLLIPTKYCLLTVVWVSSYVYMHTQCSTHLQLNAEPYNCLVRYFMSNNSQILVQSKVITHFVQFFVVELLIPMKYCLFTVVWVSSYIHAHTQCSTSSKFNAQPYSYQANVVKSPNPFCSKLFFGIQQWTPMIFWHKYDRHISCRI